MPPNSDGPFENFKTMDTGTKLQAVGNMSTIIGIALVSAGTVLKMLQNGPLPSGPVFTSNSNQNQSHDVSVSNRNPHHDGDYFNIR